MIRISIILSIISTHTLYREVFPQPWMVQTLLLHPSPDMCDVSTQNICTEVQEPASLPKTRRSGTLNSARAAPGPFLPVSVHQDHEAASDSPSGINIQLPSIIFAPLAAVYSRLPMSISDESPLLPSRLPPKYSYFD